MAACSWSDQILGSLHELQKANHFCDASIITDNGEVFCHANILVACVPEFKGVLQSEVTPPYRFQFPTSEHDVIVAIINFMYSGKLECSDNIKNKAFQLAMDLGLIPLIKETSYFAQADIGIVEDYPSTQEINACDKEVVKIFKSSHKHPQLNSMSIYTNYVSPKIDGTLDQSKRDNTTHSSEVTNTKVNFQKSGFVDIPDKCQTVSTPAGITACVEEVLSIFEGSYKNSDLNSMTVYIKEESDKAGDVTDEYKIVNIKEAVKPRDESKVISIKDTSIVVNSIDESTVLNISDDSKVVNIDTFQIDVTAVEPKIDENKLEIISNDVKEEFKEEDANLSDVESDSGPLESAHIEHDSSPQEILVLKPEQIKVEKFFDVKPDIVSNMCDNNTGELRSKSGRKIKMTTKAASANKQKRSRKSTQSVNITKGNSPGKHPDEKEKHKKSDEENTPVKDKYSPKKRKSDNVEESTSVKEEEEEYKCERNEADKGQKYEKPDRGGNFICHVCGKGVKLKKSLRVHMMRHKDKQLWRDVCLLCDKRFVSIYELKMHEKKIHEKEKPPEDERTCKICSKVFLKVGNLRNHSRHCTEEALEAQREKEKAKAEAKSCKKKKSRIVECVCATCGVVCKTVGHLKLHMARHKPITERDYKCEFCVHTFPTKFQLREHTRTHTGEKPLQCQYCGKCFAIRSTLRIHTLNHHINKFDQNCEFCGENFTRLGDLVKHCSRYHLDEEKRFKCPQCHHSYYVEQSLKSHMRIHTSKHRCLPCDKAFASRPKLLNHLAQHNVVKPYKCPECPKAYNQKRHLKQHSHRHLSTRRYPCSFCQKIFWRKNELTVHERAHTGERPFACNVCHLQFATISRLHLHEAQKHRELMDQTQQDNVLIDIKDIKQDNVLVEVNDIAQDNDLVNMVKGENIQQSDILVKVKVDEMESDETIKADYYKNLTYTDIADNIVISADQMKIENGEVFVQIIDATVQDR